MNERCEICDDFDCECQSIIDEVIAEDDCTRSDCLNGMIYAGAPAILRPCPSCNETVQ